MTKGSGTTTDSNSTEAGDVANAASTVYNTVKTVQEINKSGKGITERLEKYAQEAKETGTLPPLTPQLEQDVKTVARVLKTGGTVASAASQDGGVTAVATNILTDAAQSSEKGQQQLAKAAGEIVKKGKKALEEAKGILSLFEDHSDQKWGGGR